MDRNKEMKALGVASLALSISGLACLCCCLIVFIHTNPHAGAAPAQIEMKTEAAKFPVFCYTVLEGRHTTKHGRVSCSQLYVCKTVY